MRFRVLQAIKGQAVDLDGMRHFLWGWFVVDCMVDLCCPDRGLVQIDSFDRIIFGSIRAWDAELARNLAEAYHP